MECSGLHDRWWKWKSPQRNRKAFKVKKLIIRIDFVDWLINKYYVWCCLVKNCFILLTIRFFIFNFAWMTRSISFILCLVVVLFLIPVQVESEYELETEMICCALCYSYSRPESRSAGETVGWKTKRSFGMFRLIIEFVVCEEAKMPPARILHCVLRE